MTERWPIEEELRQAIIAPSMDEYADSAKDVAERAIAALKEIQRTLPFRERYCKEVAERALRMEE